MFHFLLSALLVIFGLWIRKGIDETPSFKKVQETGEIPKLPIVDTLKYHWREVLIAIGAKVVETAPFYIFGTFVVSYATTNLGFSRTTTLNSVMIATIVTTILIPIMGSLSDKIGRKKVYVGRYNWDDIICFPILLDATTTISCFISCCNGYWS